MSKDGLEVEGKACQAENSVPEDCDSDGCVTSEKVLDRSVLMHVLYSR